jgi:hypothetical protein
VQLVKSGVLPISSKISIGNTAYSALGIALKNDDILSAQQLIESDVDQKNVQSSINILCKKERQLSIREKDLLKKLVHTKLVKNSSFSDEEIKSLFFDKILSFRDYSLILNQIPKKQLSILFLKLLNEHHEFDNANLLELFIEQGLDLNLSLYTQKEAIRIMESFIFYKNVIQYLLKLGYNPQWGLEKAIHLGKLPIVILLLNYGADFNIRINNHCLLYQPFHNFTHYSLLTQSNIIETSIYLLERNLNIDNDTQDLIFDLFFENKILYPIRSARNDLHIIQEYNQRLSQMNKQDHQELQQFLNIFTFQHLMENPVKISSGKIYESKLLKRYLFGQYRNGRQLVCPSTNIPINESDLLKIGNDKKTIKKYKKSLEKIIHSL